MADKPTLRPCVIKPRADEPQDFSMTRFSPATDDFFFHKDMLVILHPFDVVWEAPVLARSTKSLEAHIQFIQAQNIRKAIVIAEDISFLRRCPSLESLQIIPAYSAAEFDYSPLYHLPCLRELDCCTLYGPRANQRAEVDYLRLPHLESLSVNGAKGHLHLESVKNLRRLNLGQGQPISRTLAALDTSALETLDLCQSTLRSLKGLEPARHLQKLSISHCRALTDISALSALCGTLSSLEIESCGQITDFSALHDLTNLEELTLYGTNNLPNLSFLKGMKKLRSLRFTMNVLDGDLSLCQTIPFVFCRNRKHYNLKNEDLPKQKS